MRPRVAGWGVTSSTRPSPTTQNLRPSRSAARYSAPVRSTRWGSAQPTGVVVGARALAYGFGGGRGGAEGQRAAEVPLGFGATRLADGGGAGEPPRTPATDQAFFEGGQLE